MIHGALEQLYLHLYLDLNKLSSSYMETIVLISRPLISGNKYVYERFEYDSKYGNS